MKLRETLASLMLATCVSLGANAFAAEDANLYFVHGIPGRDVAANAEPTFPVDVLINDEVCYLHGFTFGGTNGPLVLPPGQYDIKVSPANTFAPCTNAPSMESTVRLGAGQNFTAVVGLNDSGPTLTTFSNPFQSVAPGQARISIAYAGQGTAVDLVIKAANSTKLHKYTLDPGQRKVITLPSGDYTIDATTVSGLTLASETIGLPDESVTLMFAVGNTGNQSLNLLNRTIRDVF
jgi:hypothetical protein